MKDERNDDGGADSAAPRIALVAEEIDRLFEIVEFVVQSGVLSVEVGLPPISSPE
jgi:hypothetical protein